MELIGSYGNADPLDPAQWLEIDVKIASDAAVWQTRSGTCEGAVTSMNYGFVWSYVGAQTNPQARILAAHLEFGTSDLHYGLDGVQVQSFPISVTASFVQRVEAPGANLLPSPPVAISVPYDVWYPFRIDSRASSRSICHPMSVVLALTVVLTL